MRVVRCFLVSFLLMLDVALLVTPKRSLNPHSSSSSSVGSSGIFGTSRASEDRRRPGYFGQQTQQKTRPTRLRHSGYARGDAKGRKYLPLKERRPNIILIVTDDQDVELNSMKYMPNALRILRDGGAHFTNAFVTTPMCCPSRSSMLTGMYVHNHHVFTNNDNCSSPYWQQTHESRSFATYLNNAGYRTGYFGKYLNEYNGTYIPPGWREWAGLIRNSRFYNYTINRNGKKFKYGDVYHKDYYPDLITNDSLSFFRQSKQLFVNKPIMMVLSYPAPHGPEDAAPQYQSLFPNETTHRTPSWNYAPNNDKQWILRTTGKMESTHIKFTDALHRKRLQTLQSVDHALERLYNELKELGELNNTYIFYTSDHGYHLGQFGLVKGKAMPFEFDIKVPFYVRGPNVPHGISIPNIVLNLDLAPTFLDISGVLVPEHMDGKSVMKLILGAKELISEDKTDLDWRMLRKRTWRDTFLVESAGRQNAGTAERKTKITSAKPWNFISATPPLPWSDGRHPAINKEIPLSQICKSQEYRSPCRAQQKWECFYDGNRWKMQKCRPIHKSKCRCPMDSSVLNSPSLDSIEKRRQRAFLRDHVSKGFKPQFIGSRGRRSSDEFDLNGVYQLFDILTLKYIYPELEVDDKNSSDYRKTTRSVKHFPSTTTGCQLTPSNNVNCTDDVYSDMESWKQSKNNVDSQIKVLKEKLDELKGIRKHLKEKRPEDVFYTRKSKSHHASTGASSDLEPNYDDSDETVEMEETDDEKDDCQCDLKPFGKNPNRTGYRRGSQSEARKRQKEERRWKMEDKLKRQERKNRRKQKYENYTCNIEKMNCFVHDNDHWKTPPLWTDGPFCFCQNSNNNTYWCSRTINATHNFLFCEFITGFVSYYNITADPYQMENIVSQMPFKVLSELHHQLMKLRTCKGAKECTFNSKVKGNLTYVTASHKISYFGGQRRGRHVSSVFGSRIKNGRIANLGTESIDPNEERDSLSSSGLDSEETIHQPASVATFKT